VIEGFQELNLAKSFFERKWSSTMQQEGGILGTARSIQQRAELLSGGKGQVATKTILTFRLEQYGTKGHQTRVVPVEMRGYSMTGFINEGDQVQVFGKTQNGLVLASQAHNLTTGPQVEAAGYLKTYKTSCIISVIVGLIALVIFLAFFGFVVLPILLGNIR